jgi:Bacterial Ig-like domain (group 3)
VIFAASNTQCSAVDNVSISGWKLTLGINSTASSTTTVISSGKNPSTAGASVTFTATVSTASSGQPTGTVAFTAGVPNADGTIVNTTLCSAQPLSGAGGNSSTATCTTTALSTQGINSINAAYTPTGGFSGSDTPTPLSQLVEPAAITPSGTPWCNSAPLVIPGGFGNPSSAAYPSIIPVTGISQSVASLTVQLHGINAGPGVFDGGQFLLVAPGGGTYNLDFLSQGFPGLTPGSDVNLTLADDAGQSVPAENTSLTSGSYIATDNHNVADVFPSPVSSASSIDSNIPGIPGSLNYAQPYGGSGALNFEGAFNGAPASGDWSLYIVNNEGTGSGDGITLSGGWCVDFTLNTGSPTSTTVTSSQRSASTGSQVTITATVTSGGNPVTSGTVTFTENGVAPPGTVGGNNVVTLNGGGQATFATSSLGEGDHKIVAAYSGTADYNLSSNFIWQRVDHPTTVGTPSGNHFQFCNTGTVALPFSAIGSATPNPSNIFVAGLPGTINTIGIQLTNFEIPFGVNDLASLLVGPAQTNAATLNFFSGAGSNSVSLAEGNYIFADSGSGLAPTTSFGPGTYKPTDYDSALTFTQSPSMFETLAGPYNLR